jgi:hypothetical protein
MRTEVSASAAAEIQGPASSAEVHRPQEADRPTRASLSSPHEMSQSIVHPSAI